MDEPNALAFSTASSRGVLEVKGVAKNQIGLPLVSIIVPVFNGERYLRESLDSILTQTYPRTEVLVMDDASTDDTPSVVASYGDRVHYYRQPQNRGIYGNVNDGIAMARGEYIATYHADDVYCPCIVEREVEFLQRYPDAGAVFCQAIFIDAQGSTFGRLEIPLAVRGERPLDYPLIFNALLEHKNHLFWCPSSMVCAAVYHDVGFYHDEGFRNSADLEMWLRIARKYPVGILEDYLLCYRHGHDNSSHRYHYLRTDSERYFQIMDLHLAEGGKALATSHALAAYEAHRAEDRLMCAINCYILDRLDQSLAILQQVHARQILGSSRIQRYRLLVLLLALLGLARLPRIPSLANLFYRHWHAKGSRKRQNIMKP